MSTPPLEHATGAEHSDIFIKDVVQRVKCELSDTFDRKTEQPEFLWLASWTAHADLILQVNDTAGIAPNGSYTEFLGKSAATKGKTVLTSVVDTFSLSASANLSGAASRSETVSFTIALDELKMWRRHIEKIEAGLPPQQRTCNFDPSTGVTGNLGLKEWVDSAFFPVELHELEAGIHPGPGAGKPGSTSGPKASASKAAEKSALSPMDQVKVWQQKIQQVQKDTTQTSANVAKAAQTIKDAETTIKNSINDAKQFKYVLVAYLQARYARVSGIIKAYVKNSATCSLYKTELDRAADLASTILSTGSLTGYDELEGFMTKIDSGTFETDYSDCASTLQAQAQEAQLLPKALPDQVDPPIDSVLHSVTFVVTYGAGISPSWTLLQWKGPGAGQTPMLSASSVRTHTLNLSLGPRSGGPAISGDALRLILNQTIRNIGTVPGG